MDLDERRRALLAFLGRVGPAKAVELQHHLGLSQPAFSRLAHTAAEDLLVVGRARATRYAARRPIAGIEGQTSVYAVDEAGGTARVADLHAVQPRGFYWESLRSDVASRFYDDLPYLLLDERPAGYLGRLVPKRHPDLGAPLDITRWSADDCLRYFVRYGWDLPGNLIVGDAALMRYLEDARTEGTAIATEDRSELYPRIADDVLAHGPPGSSAAGEQPKFLARRAPGAVDVLVKVSPRLEGVVAERVADLLICEHVGHRVLVAHGYEAPRSELVRSRDRLFLEVERFDRTSAHGRRGVLSLLALDVEHVGTNLSSWSATAGALERQGRLSAEAARRIRELELFGALIGNTDMHFGNLSLLMDGERVLGVAPAYDMVPMLFAPEHGQLVARMLAPRIPEPTQADAFERPWRAALDFWAQVVREPGISASFVPIAMASLRVVGELEDLVRRLPR
ncbi:MAG: type II toxin-antitoxin system HipA family toxin YjjJ [Myxococcota bacterium]